MAKFPRLYKKKSKIAKALRSQSISSFLRVASSIFWFRFIQKFRDLKYSYKDHSLPILLPAKKVTNQFVTIIIPFRDNISLLKRCLNSILDKTTYKDYKIILINNQSVEAETFEYLSSLNTNPIISIISYDKPFNYSAMHNWAMEHVQTENVLLLNNDVEVISSDWLQEMINRIEQDEVGVVGALLLFPNGTIQHAGVGIYPEVACHLYEGELPDGNNRKIIGQCRELYAVTGACLMTKKSTFNAVQGMDAENLPVNFNDVDYCLRLKQRGFKIVFEPAAKLYHYESYTRGNAWSNISKYQNYRKEYLFFWKKWRKFIESVVR